MPNRILILTDSVEDAETLKTVLAKAGDGPFVVECLHLLAAGLARLGRGGIAAVLVDLSLPDSTGIATFDQLFAASPQTPIMILSAGEEEPLAIEAVQRGAQGYLTKGYFKSYIVPQGLRNIIQRKAVEESLYQEKARAEITLNSISDGLISTDIDGRVDYINTAAEKLTGWSRDEANGRSVLEVFRIINGDSGEAIRDTVKLVLANDRPVGLPMNTLLIRKDGSQTAIEDSAAPIHDRNGELSGVVIVFHDVSAAKALNEKIAHLAHHDVLTNLPNRAVLNDRITQAIAQAKRDHTHLALLFMDLDNFKQINDSHGHAIGDDLLQAVAERLRQCMRDSDTISRHGGDEFVILLSRIQSADDAAVIAEKILDALALPHGLDSLELQVTTSIGISVYPDDGQSPEMLIKNADSAMYVAKKKGRNNHQRFQQLQQQESSAAQ